ACLPAPAPALHRRGDRIGLAPGAVRELEEVGARIRGPVDVGGRDAVLPLRRRRRGGLLAGAGGGGREERGTNGSVHPRSTPDAGRHFKTARSGEAQKNK